MTPLLSSSTYDLIVLVLLFAPVTAVGLWAWWEKRRERKANEAVAADVRRMTVKQMQQVLNDARMKQLLRLGMRSAHRRKGL